MDKSFIIKIVIILIGIGVAIVALVAYNTWGADLSTLPRETTVVERVYHKTEYSTRRVSRRVYVRDHPHEVYYLTLRRPDGSKKNVKVKYRIYQLASKGDTAILPIGPGRLGWEISDPDHITIPHPRHPSPRRHCRFVGTSGSRPAPPIATNPK